MDWIENHVTSYPGNGILKKAWMKSEVTSPAFLVRKADPKRFRMVVDMRRLNVRLGPHPVIIMC